MINLELSKEELEVLEVCVFRRMVTLENADLKDSHCYPLLYSIHNKINKELKK